MQSDKPENYRSVTATIIVDDLEAAITFYKAAFDAREVSHFKTPGGEIIHAELQIGDTRLMLGTECPDSRCASPAKLGGTSCVFYLYTADADAALEKAVQAGATGDMPVHEMFWGDRLGQVTDPFGHRWSLATHVADLSDDEIRRRGEEFFAARSAG